MKSIARIHQQTLDILARMSRRPHTTRESMDKVIRIHNGYLRAAAGCFGHLECATLTPSQINASLTLSQYRGY